MKFKTLRLILVLSLIIPTVLLGGISVSADYLQRFEYYEESDSQVDAKLLTQVGQTFLSPGDHDIQQLQLDLYLAGTANGSVYFYYYETAGGLPTGGPIAWAIISSANIPTVAGGTPYTIPISSYVSTIFRKDTLYALVISYPGGAGFNLLQVDADVYSPDYSEGWYISSVDGGASFVANANYDLKFANYGVYRGYVNEDVVVQTGEANLTQTVGGNFTVQIPVSISPDYVSQNVTAHLSENTDFSSPVPLFKWYGHRTDNYTWHNMYSDINLGWQQYGFLSTNKTYYYQGRASINGTVFFGNIRTLSTHNVPGTPSKPVIAMRSVSDISENTNNDYEFVLGGQFTQSTVNGTITSDPIIYKGFKLSTSRSAAGALLPPIITINNFNNNSDGTFQSTVIMDNYDWYNDQTIYIQAFVNTPWYGTITSSTISFRPGDDIQSDESTDPTAAITTVTSMIESSLQRQGFLNDTGKYMIIVIAMIAAYVFTRHSKLLSVILPLLVFGFGIIIGWLPVWLVITLGLAAGVSAYAIIKRKTEGSY